jgi:hypothetical protein
LIHVPAPAIFQRFASGPRSPDAPVVLVPGHHFFTLVCPLPVGTPASEARAAIDLALEPVAPFPLEQLARGYYAPAGAGLALAAAAYRRKFTPAELDSWKGALAVVPDFATWLPRAAGVQAVVVLETPGSVTALDCRGGPLPERVVSRAVMVAQPELAAVPANVAAEVGADAADNPAADAVARAGGAAGSAVNEARARVLERVATAGRPVWHYRLAEVPCLQAGAQFHFQWEALDGAPNPAAAPPLSSAELWALDLREAGFLQARRREFLFNRIAWNALLMGAAAAVFLLLLELGLVVGGQVLKRQQARVAAQAPEVSRIETNLEIVERLEAYGPRKPQPLGLLAYINDLRPRSIHFTRAVIEASGAMVIDAATANLADVNEYEAALRTAPGIGSVELRNVRSREGGATFQLVLAFREGFRPAGGKFPDPPVATAAARAVPQNVPVPP